MKKLILSLFCLAAALGVAAQSRYDVVSADSSYIYNNKRVITNTFWHNWFVQAGAGLNLGFTEHDKQASIGQRLAPALNISVGKWFTPGIGLRFAYSGLTVKGITQNFPGVNVGSHISGPWPGHDNWPLYLYKQKFNYLNFHIDAMFNLCNLIGGYKPERLYSCIPWAGVGVAHVTSTPKNTEITFNAGLLNSFRINDHIDINLEISAMICDERFSGETGNRHFDGVLSATAGLTYRIGGGTWERPVTSSTVVVDNEAINEMRKKNAELEAENKRLRDEYLREKNKKVDVVAQLIASGNVIFFKIDTWQITDKSRANLSFLAQAIKNTQGIYTVTGYADKGTGTPEWNAELSKKRAEAAYKCLINEFGVPADRLQIDYKGGVDDMFFDDPRCSRCVIVLPLDRENN